MLSANQTIFDVARKITAELQEFGQLPCDVMFGPRMSEKGGFQALSIARKGPSKPRTLLAREGAALSYLLGGLIMICAPAVPAFISQGALSLAFVDSPVDSGVAKGT